MAEKKHWSAEPSSYRMSREHDDIWALVYDPTPGGRKNDDGTTTYSIRFPAMVLSEYVEGPEKVAADLARSLNSHNKLVEAMENLVAWKHAVDTIAPELGGILVAIYNAEAVLASLQPQEEGQP